MSLRILFADDSVTAQNMGKKILIEAGYEVVAVSNGAAAVKKIAEQKPDIIILDVYMPGYTGLEVCEKVRGSAATVKTPVLLTVGKLEPYKPEDARRVRADGVIIKPFEASDLLAIIKKFEERISQNAPPPPPPVVEEPAEEMRVTPPEPAEHHEPQPNRNMQPMVEVPDHMASTSAFSDLLGGDQAHAMPNLAPPPPPPPVQSAPEPPPSAVQETEIPVSWRPDVEPQPIMVTEAPPAPAPVAAAPEPAPEPVAAPEPVSAPAVVVAAQPEPEAEAAPAPIPPGPVPGRPKHIPVYQEPEANNEPESVPTAAGPLGDIDIDVREPALMTAQPTAGPLASAAPVAGASQTGAASVPAEPAVSRSIAPVTEITAAPRRDIADADFEARVAAALAAYGHQAASAVSGTPVAVEAPPAPAEPPAAAAPSFEYRPPVTAPEPPPAPVEQVVATAPAVAGPAPVPEPAAIAAQPVPEERVPASVNHDDVLAKLEETLPVAAAAVAKAAGGEHDTIAEAVNRVMERMKGDLVDEIVRELKSKK